MMRQVISQGKAHPWHFIGADSSNFPKFKNFRCIACGSKDCIYSFKKKKFKEGALHTQKQALPEGIVSLGENLRAIGGLPPRAL